MQSVTERSRDVSLVGPLFINSWQGGWQIILMIFAFEIFWQQLIVDLVIDHLTLTQEVKFNNITMVRYLDPADESVISSLIHTNPI